MKYRSETKKAHEILDNASDPQQTIERAELLGILMRSIGRLPVQYREAIVLRYLEGYSYGELGQIQSIPAALARWRVYYGKLMLQRSLIKDGVIKRGWTP